jgi:hypothetical protein
VDDLDELWRVLDRVAVSPRLLVACDFDDVLAPDLGDPDDARAEQVSSEALNVLLALPRTTVAVVSHRDPEQVAELMMLSGSKGGLRYVGPGDVDELRVEAGATALVRVRAAAGPAADPRPDDLVVTVTSDEEQAGAASGYVVEDTEIAAEVLEELARLRRGT